MKDLLDNIFVGASFLIFAPIAISKSIGDIFMPKILCYSEDHLKSCWLKHETMKDRFWHMLDTKLNIASFQGSLNTPPSKKSPNRKSYLEHAKKFYFEQIKYDSGCFKGYKDYCEKELIEIENELKILCSNNS